MSRDAFTIVPRHCGTAGRIRPTAVLGEVSRVIKTRLELLKHTAAGFSRIVDLSGDCRCQTCKDSQDQAKNYVGIPVIRDIAHLLELDRENQLSLLKAVPDGVAMGIAERHAGISKQYLDFIHIVGVGSTRRDFYIYEPEPASHVEQHSSFQLYQSASYRTLSGKGQCHPIPADAVMIADSGFAWRYCLCPSLGEKVFCLDMGGPTFETEAEDFFSFVANTVL